MGVCGHREAVGTAVARDTVGVNLKRLRDIRAGRVHVGRAADNGRIGQAEDRAGGVVEVVGSDRGLALRIAEHGGLRDRDRARTCVGRRIKRELINRIVCADRDRLRWTRAGRLDDPDMGTVEDPVDWAGDRRLCQQGTRDVCNIKTRGVGVLGVKNRLRLREADRASAGVGRRRHVEVVDMRRAREGHRLGRCRVGRDHAAHAGGLGDRGGDDRGRIIVDVVLDLGRGVRNRVAICDADALAV